MARGASSTFADLLAYPAPGTQFPAAADAPEVVREFLAETATLSRGELEELYPRTFDINPVSSLEVGWHLYGEQYDRGAFLVRMRDALRRAGLEEGTELPDHLTTALRLLARLPEAEASVFAREAVLPALEKMTKGFEDGENPYGGLVRAVRSAVAPCAAPEAEAEGGAR